MQSAVLAPMRSNYLRLSHRDAWNSVLRMDDDPEVGECSCEGLVEIHDAFYLLESRVEGDDIVIGFILVGREGTIDLRPVLYLLVLNVLCYCRSLALDKNVGRHGSIHGCNIRRFEVLHWFHPVLLCSVSIPTPRPAGRTGKAYHSVHFARRLARTAEVWPRIS